MSKIQTYVYTIASLIGEETFKYYRYHAEESRAIAEGCKLKIQDDDIDYIVIRRSDGDGVDPIIWDSRKAGARRDIKDFEIQAAMWKFSKAQADFIREMINASANNKTILDVLCSGDRDTIKNSIKFMRLKP